MINNKFEQYNTKQQETTKILSKPDPIAIIQFLDLKKKLKL